MKRTQLIIFDCDGVLVDSEPVANRTLGQMLRELGLDLTQEEIFRNFVGYSLPHCMRVIEGMLGRPPPENFLRDLQARTFAAFKTELRAMPGIEEALDRIGLPFCVASSGDHDWDGKAGETNWRGNYLGLEFQWMGAGTLYGWVVYGEIHAEDGKLPVLET